MNTARTITIVLFLLACASVASAQTPATPSQSLAWDQGAASVAEATGFRYDATVDALPSVTLNNVACAGPASPFVCQAPLPAMTSGQHTIVLRAIRVVGTSLLPSPNSAPLSLLMMAVPATPQSLRVITT